jgi:glycosyltransferase involved in cell wall biosynthesis
VYTQNLSRALVKEGHEVNVFSRKEDPFRPDYEMGVEADMGEPRIRLHLVNLPNSRDRYRHDEVDESFKVVLGEFDPDVIHIGHLNHLSTSLVEVAATWNVPIVFTLHDYWLMCPRGQFVQTNLGGSESRKLCDGQEDHKCATSCYSRYYSGSPESGESDVEYWTEWVGNRMSHIRKMDGHVSMFIAPSHYLLRRFVDDFGLQPDKLVYLDYGFDHSRLTGRLRIREREFVFGYIGTHTVPKGINLLIEAFGKIIGNAKLRIWGRQNPEVTPGLKELVAGLPGDCQDRVEWMGEYRNEDVVRAVFDRVDSIVVPSIWVENSPLVIHEAQQAKVPVITAGIGGMAEYVSDGTNGLLFAHRDPLNLARKMQMFVDNPALASELGRRGYLKSPAGDVPTIEEHVSAIVSLYERVLQGRVIRA